MPKAVPLLNAEDFCKIISACAQNGVISIKMDGLEACFQAPVHIAHQAVPATDQAEKDLGDTIRAQQNEEVRSIEEQDLKLKEDRLAELMLTDPFEAEKLMQLGELEPIEDGVDGTDEEL